MSSITLFLIKNYFLNDDDDETLNYFFLSPFDDDDAIVTKGCGVVLERAVSQIFL